MKVKMTRWFQGRNQPTLALGSEYELPDGLGEWLVKNHMAAQVVELEPVPDNDPEFIHYGAQAEPELAHDDELYQRIIAEPEPQPEPEASQPKTKRRRGKK
jgi:hypothetical protein